MPHEGPDGEPSESAPLRRGSLKVFLGYAAGVGKTYQMLEEAQELKLRGADVVIGYFEPHKRIETIAKTDRLEVVPRREIEYRGRIFEEMDPVAIIERSPGVCVVDEFAHTNVPGSARVKRWEDVLFLLENGIDVLTTVNIQHLESLNDKIFEISGVRVRETVPDWVIAQATEVVMVDLTPRALLNRLERGVVYEPEKARNALQNFFRETTLGALRELALRQTAHEVDLRQAQPDEFMGDALKPPAQEQGSSEKVLLVVTDHPDSTMLIRRGKRVADYLRAECFAVAVTTGGKEGDSNPANSETEKHLEFARTLQIETRELQDENPAEAIVGFARARHVTQIFIARAGHRAWHRFIGGNLIHQLVRGARDMQITIVADRRRSG